MAAGAAAAIIRSYCSDVLLDFILKHGSCTISIKHIL